MGIGEKQVIARLNSCMHAIIIAPELKHATLISWNIYLPVPMAILGMFIHINHIC